MLGSHELVGKNAYPFTKGADPTPGSETPIGTAANPHRHVGYKWDVIGMAFVIDTTSGGAGGDVVVTNAPNVHVLDSTLPTGAATSALQTTGNVSLAAIDAKLPVLIAGRLPVDLGVSAGLTDTQLRATPVPMSLADGANVTQGAKADAAWDGAAATPTIMAVWKYAAAKIEAVRALLAGTLTVSGPLTDAQLRAAAVPVSDNGGSFTVDAPVATPVATRLSDGAAFIDPRDVSDRDARLAGRVKLLSSAGAVIDAALDATLTGGTQKAIARGGAKGATAAADLTSTAEGADHQALDVQIMHGGAAKDPTQIRALTNADVVKAQLQDNAGTAVTVGQKTMASSLPVALASDQGAVPVSDNAGSLTVDAPVGTPVFSRLSDGAAALIGQKVMASSLPVVLASDQSTVPVVGVPETTYHALMRLAARPYALSKAAIAANSRTQFATLYHAAAATKRLRLRRVLIAFESESVAGMITFDLVKLTAAVTPATGNPAITPTPAKSSAGAAEATALALPTTGGTEGALIGALEFNVGITGAVGVTNPPQPTPWYELFSEDEQSPISEQEALEIAAGVAGGWAVVVDNVGATNTVKCLIKFVFTEK